MSAGNRIIQMRETARDLLPYLNHLASCRHYRGDKCSCKLTVVVERAKRLANMNPARTLRQS